MENLSFSLEDYIEEIYRQILGEGFAKVTKISENLGVKKASVTKALNVLSAKGLVNYVPYSPISLTSEGEKVAENIYKKHRIISDFFVKTLNVDEKEAQNVACEMEHVISQEFFEKIKKVVEG